MPDSDVLTPKEQEIINVAIDTINTGIRSIATTYGLAFVDAYQEMELWANGITLSDGTLLTTDFPTGGLFSLDGIHPSPRGNALIANSAIDAINTTYNQTLDSIVVNNVNNFY